VEPRAPGDRCRRADGEDDRPHASVPAGPAVPDDLSHGLGFLCTLHGGHPARLVAEADSFGDLAAVIVHDPPAATSGGDTLLIGESEPPYPGAAIVEGEDLDGDGWTDVRRTCVRPSSREAAACSSPCSATIRPADASRRTACSPERAA
jgi:hypothetical protein